MKAIISLFTLFCCATALQAAELKYRFRSDVSEPVQNGFNRLWSEVYPEVIQISPPRIAMTIEIDSSSPVTIREGSISITGNQISELNPLLSFLLLEGILYQTSNGLHNGPEWFEARTETEANVIAQKLRLNPGSIFQSWGMVTSSTGFNNLMGPQVLSSQLSFFRKTDDGSLVQATNLPNSYSQGSLIYMWNLIASASGKADFWAQLNTAYQKSSGAGEETIFQIVERLVLTIDGQKPRDWIIAYPIMQKRKPGEYLGVTANPLGLEIPLLSRNSSGAESYPISPSVAIDNYDSRGNRVPYHGPRGGPFGFDRFLFRETNATYGVPSFSLEPTTLYRTKAVTFYKGTFLLATNYVVLPGTAGANFVFACVDPKCTMSSPVVPAKAGSQVFEFKVSANFLEINGTKFAVMDSLRVVVDRSMTHHLTVVHDGFHGLALSNPTDEDVSVVLNAFDQMGRLLKTVTQLIPAKSQVAKLVPEWLGMPVDAVEQVIITAAREDLKPFQLFGDFAGGSLDGGNVPSRPAKNLIFTQVDGLQQISLVNPGKGQTFVNIEYYDARGRMMTSSFKTLGPALGPGSSAIENSLAPPNLEYVKVKADQPILATVTAASPGQSDFSFIEGQDLDAPVITSNDLAAAFPHVAIGADWRTSIDVYCADDKPCALNFEIRDNNGMLHPEVGANNVPIKLNPGEAVRTNAAEAFKVATGTVVSGSIRILPDSANPKFHASVKFGRGSQEESTLVVKRYSSHQLTFNQLATTAGYFTAVGVLNVLGQDVDMTLEVYDGNGQRLGTYQKTLPPYGRLVDFVDNLVPQAKGKAGGWFRVAALPKNADATKPLPGPALQGFALFGKFGQFVAAIPGEEQ